MEPPCGQSIVKCEKQKDDGRMETQKRKQNKNETVVKLIKIDKMIMIILRSRGESASFLFYKLSIA